MTALDLSHSPRRAPSRRQALKILGASAALPIGIVGWQLFGPQPTFHHWHGTALGSEASMSLWHANPGHARRTLAHMASEVLRLENIFSLFRPESELSRLNRAGVLKAASQDLVRVLETTRAVAQASSGAFDPTVQPLWSIYQSHFALPQALPDGPAEGALEAAHRRVDYREIDVSGSTVSLGLSNMALTLNGIAQGYITDVVADLLRNEGFDHVVVELGESRVLGTHPDGRPWRVGLKDAQGQTGRTIGLVNQASATSGGYGTVFEPTGLHHHIFDPLTGKSANRLTEVVVIAPRATEADALATAIFVAGAERAPDILATAPEASAIITNSEGLVTQL
tara:strand:+ start:17772 stop:18788 length:1017 start_codon:yes stop_codon:yes gene_type:complete